MMRGVLAIVGLGVALAVFQQFSGLVLLNMLTLVGFRAGLGTELFSRLGTPTLMATDLGVTILAVALGVRMTARRSEGDAEIPKTPRRFNTPLILAAASLVLVWAPSLFFIFFGIFYGDDNFVTNLTRLYLVALMAVTAAAFQAVRAEGYTPVVWLAACLLLVFSWLGGFTIGLLYAPSAFLMLFAAVTMRED